MGKRCFSKCRGLKQSDCVKPCSFVNDRYCRLSSTLKMVPPDCLIEKRMKNEKPKSLKRVKSVKGVKGVKSVKRKTPFLNMICTDSNECIAFGKERKKLINFFDFSKFKHARNSGVGKEIKYERDGYISHALLKTHSGSHSDNENIAYEYLIGQYLNELSAKVPSFIETHGLFLYPDKEQRDVSHVNLATTLIPITPDKTAMVCVNQELECILLQQFKHAKILTQLTRNPHFFIYDAIYVFYQVYFTLSMMRKVFTHYDLHCNNVLLYEPIHNGYIEYHYHLPKEVITFKSSYLVKMIHYGRGFFKGSKSYYDAICQEPRCEPHCGEKKGFYYFEEDPEKEADKHYINSLHKNESHDLLLLKEYQQLTSMKMKSHKNKYIHSFVQVFEDIVYSTKKGTPEDLSHSDKIHNVGDVEKRLRVLLQDPVRQRINDLSYAKSKKIGELHVYTNGKDLEFISQKNI
jgi:hypothetical protein